VRLFIVASLLILAAPESRADDVVGARAHFDKGSSLYDIGKYIEAAHEYEQAYTLKADPALLFNIGQAYRQANESAAALRVYRSYLRRVPNAPNRAEVERHIVALQRLTDEQQRVASSPPTSTIQPTEAAPRTESKTTEPASRPIEQEAKKAEPEVKAAEPIVVATPEPPPRTPIYRKWWLWTAVGVVVAGGAAAAIAVTTAPRDAAIPSGAINLTFH
jgi:tetratricopeptide (TPR) repeat protein